MKKIFYTLLILIVLLTSLAYKEEKQIREYVSTPIIKKDLKKSIKEIFHWEQMYIELYKKIEKDNPELSIFAEKIKKDREETLNGLIVITKKYRFFNRDYYKDGKGNVNFYIDNINKLYYLLSKDTTNTQKMLKYSCILLNSAVYKYSELIKEESQEYNKYALTEAENKSIEDLLFLDDFIKKNYNKKGCCEISKVLCPMVTKKEYSFF